jgi:hypothetical protein
MLEPEFCWICGKLWRVLVDGAYSHWFFSDGPFGYGICKKCMPIWEVARPIAASVYNDTPWPTKNTHELCIVCRETTYEGRSLYNHPRCLGMGRDYMLCGDCRGPIDEARHAAQEAERALRPQETG